MKTLWNDIVHFFYPNLCLLCKNRLIEGEQQICLNCLCQLPRTAFYSEDNNPVLQLLIDKEKLQHATAFLYFDKGGKVQRLIHSLKYGDNKKIGYLLGRQAALELLATNHPLSQADYLLPLPLHRRKLRKRGYNQSEWIAKGIQSILDKPILSTAIKREVYTQSQTSKSNYNRWLNVKDIFTVVDEKELVGKHILLIDDVITSGATAGACIDALSNVPDIRISFLALCMTQY